MKIKNRLNKYITFLSFLDTYSINVSQHLKTHKFFVNDLFLLNIVIDFSLKISFSIKKTKFMKEASFFFLV